MLQDNEKVNVQYLRNLLFDLFELLELEKDFHFISNFVAMAIRIKLIVYY